MRRAIGRALAVLGGGVLGLAASGCGAGQGGDDTTVDASPVSDAGGNDGAGCAVGVTFQPPEAQRIAPVDISATAEIFGGSGVFDYAWQVYLGGQELAFTGSGPTIQFRADEPGLYTVAVFVGASCQTLPTSLLVRAPGANTRAVRLRFAPPPALAAPPQERVVIVSGSTDAPADVTLDPGVVFPITVRTATPAPVPAYLRFTSRATPDVVVESFSDAAGAADVRLIAGRYDVLVVPTSPTLAPRLVADWDPLLGALTVDAGLPLGGTVLDAAGLPVAGARVSLTSGGVPSTIATTAADGGFALRWREGGTVEALTVVAPDGAALPRLDAQLEVGARTELTVRHAAVPSSDLGGTEVRVGGVPQPATDVLVALGRPACGTIADGATVLAQAAGSHRRTLRTDGAGRLPAARFVDGTGGAFIASAGPGATTALALPLGGALTAAAPVTVTGHVVPTGGGDLGGARVRAELTGALAHAGAPTPAVTTGADGRFAIQLAAGAPYALTITDPTAADAALVQAIPAAAAAELGDLALRAAVAIVGVVRVTGESAGARAVGVTALCHLDCAGLERTRPLGEAVTDAVGRYVVAVPDPGITP